MRFPFALAMTVACSIAQAAQFPTRESAIVAYKAELNASCAEHGSAFEFQPGFMRDVDLNGDGVPDTILSTEQATCAAAHWMYAGSAGEAARWVVSMPDGGFETLDFVYHKVEVDAAAKPPRIKLFLHGSSCGRGGVETCRHVFRLDGAKVVSVAWPDGQFSSGKAPRFDPPVEDPSSAMQADHNGSTVELLDDRIVYATPKASLRGVVKPGDLLVEGKWTGDRFAGTAYAFKKGCPPAPYAVSGAKVQRPGQLDLVLRGAGPIRQGCEVVGYSDRSPHSRLVFERIMSE